MRRLRKLDRTSSDLSFSKGTPLRNFFNRMTITVATGKIHLGVGIIRIFAQCLLDNTHAFDEIAPIHRTQKAQAANAVADRNLVGSLKLVSGMHQLLDGQS